MNVEALFGENVKYVNHGSSLFCNTMVYALCQKTTKVTYHMVKKFGKVFNLVIWRSRKKLPN